MSTLVYGLEETPKVLSQEDSSVYYHYLPEALQTLTSVSSTKMPDGENIWTIQHSPLAQQY